MTFVIDEKLKEAADGVFNFRDDEINFLSNKVSFSKRNKYYDLIFDSSRKVSLENVELYLFTFFNNIQNADFPLGHKYVDLESEGGNSEIDFVSICKNFHELLSNYKKNNDDQEYVLEKEIYDE